MLFSKPTDFSSLNYMTDYVTKGLPPLRGNMEQLIKAVREANCNTTVTDEDGNSYGYTDNGNVYSWSDSEIHVNPSMFDGKSPNEAAADVLERVDEFNRQKTKLTILAVGLAFVAGLLIGGVELRQKED